MKKCRQRFLEMKEGFLDAKSETMKDAFSLANKVVIGTIYLFACCLSTIFMTYNLAPVTYIFYAIASVALVAFGHSRKLFNKVMPLSTELLLHFFGKYGRVVTEQDWKYIKKQNYKLYREVNSKESCGYCYFYSWAVALLLRDAKLMYCSIEGEGGKDTAHAVILKNNCVYCTNARRHFSLEEYKDYLNVKIYKIFSEKEFVSETFFDDIREDFVKWCAENNVYCDPQ